MRKWQGKNRRAGHKSRFRGEPERDREKGALVAVSSVYRSLQTYRWIGWTIEGQATVSCGTAEEAHNVLAMFCVQKELALLHVNTTGC